MNIQVIKSEYKWSDQEREETLYKWSKILNLNYEIFHQMEIAMKNDNQVDVMLKIPSIIELKIQKLLEFANVLVSSDVCVLEKNKNKNKIGASELKINTTSPVLFRCKNTTYKNKEIYVQDIEFINNHLHNLKSETHDIDFSAAYDSGYLPNTLALDLFVINHDKDFIKNANAELLDKVNNMLQYNLQTFKIMQKNSWMINLHPGVFWKQLNSENTVEKLYKPEKIPELENIKKELQKIEQYHDIKFTLLWKSAVINDLARFNLTLRDIKNPEKLNKILQILEIKKTSNEKHAEKLEKEFQEQLTRRKMEWIYKKKYKQELNWDNLTDRLRKILELELQREKNYKNLGLHAITSKQDYKRLLDELNISNAHVKEKIDSREWILGKNNTPIICSHVAFIYEHPENYENLQKLIMKFGEKTDYKHHCATCGELLYEEDNADAVSFSEVSYFSANQDELAQLIWTTTRTITENEIAWKVPPKQKTRYEFISNIAGAVYNLVDSVHKKLQASKTMSTEEMELNIYFYTGLYIYAILIYLVLDNFKKIKFTGKNFAFEKTRKDKLEEYVLMRISSFFNTTLKKLQEIRNSSITEVDLKNFLNKTLQNVSGNAKLWKIKEVRALSLLEYIILDPRFLALRMLWIYSRKLDKKTIMQSWMPINILGIEFTTLENRGDPWYVKIPVNIAEKLKIWNTEIEKFTKHTRKSYDILHSLNRYKLALDFVIKYSQLAPPDISQIEHYQEFAKLETNINLALKHINISTWDLMAPRGTDRQFPGFNTENPEHWKQLNLIYGSDHHRHKWSMENEKIQCKSCKQDYYTRKDIRNALKRKYNITNFYNYYSYNCPKGQMHEFVNEICKKCKLSYSMIEKQNVEYYEKWNVDEKMQELKLNNKKTMLEKPREFILTDNVKHELIINIVNKVKLKYNKQDLQNILHALGCFTNNNFKAIKRGLKPDTANTARYSMLHSHISESYFIIGQVLNIQNVIQPAEKLVNINPGKLNFSDMNTAIKKDLKLQKNYFELIPTVEKEQKPDLSFAWFLSMLLNIIPHSVELAEYLLKKAISFEKRFSTISDAKKAKARSKLQKDISETYETEELQDDETIMEDTPEVEIGFGFDFDMDEMENTETDV